MTRPEIQEFEAPRSMTPGELADTLARLVWEDLSDFVADAEDGVFPGDLGLTPGEEGPRGEIVEELLIFLMWAHTRGLQMAFLSRAPEELVRQGLDAFHSAIYQDLVDRGISRTQLPLFEQRVSTRYTEYHRASERSDLALGRNAARRITGSSSVSRDLARALARRALALAHPLRDFLEEVELVPED